MKVEFHPDAENELIESALFYEKKVSNLGCRFIADVERYSQLIGDHSETGQTINHKFRYLTMDNYPYSLIPMIPGNAYSECARFHPWRRCSSLQGAAMRIVTPCPE